MSAPARRAASAISLPRCSVRSAVRPTSNTSTCRPRCATATSISPRPRSSRCAAPATMRASRRWKTRWRATPRSSLPGPTGIAEETALALSTHAFDRQLAAFTEQTVLCVGDLMLDEFNYGGVGRISPEAPAPVIAVERHERMAGAAANVARNIAGLGAHCVIVGLVGEDEGGRLLMQALAAETAIETYLVVDRARP